MLFNLFDGDKNGEVSFTEFLNALIGLLNPVRTRLVQDAFYGLDQNNSGALDLDEVKIRFDPSRHPDVRANVKTIEEVRFEFLNLFTSLHSTTKGFKNERAVTLEDFLEYHQYVST